MALIETQSQTDRLGSKPGKPWTDKSTTGQNRRHVQVLRHKQGAVRIHRSWIRQKAVTYKQMEIRAVIQEGQSNNRKSKRWGKVDNSNMQLRPRLSKSLQGQSCTEQWTRQGSSNKCNEEMGHSWEGRKASDWNGELSINQCPGKRGKQKHGLIRLDDTSTK